MSDEQVHAGTTRMHGIDEATEDQPGPADEAASEYLSRYAFSVGGLNLLVGEGTLCEVMDIPPIARVPHTAHWFLGLVNLRGEIVPVFDLARVLGRGTSRKSAERLLVIGRGEVATGVLIDDLPVLQHFVTADQAEASTALSPPLESCVTGCFAKDGKEWIEFAHERLFETIADEVPLR